MPSGILSFGQRMDRVIRLEYIDLEERTTKIRMEMARRRRLRGRRIAGALSTSSVVLSMVPDITHLPLPHQYSGW
jgi:hypothetical protein